MSVEPQYLDFELRIDDLGGGRYRATVTDMPLGEEQGQVSNEFTLPFSDDELNRALAVLSGRLKVSSTEREKQARTFGEALFKAVFSGPVYTVYFSSRAHARTAQGLRIKLALDSAGAIADLPWEFLRDPAVDYLALSRGTPVIRYPRRLVIRPRPVFSPPLRVLVMVSTPIDLNPVDVQSEWQQLQTATASLQKRGLIELHLLEDATLRTLQRMLRTQEYHVFHYIGHSSFDTATGQGMLAMEDPYGQESISLVRGEDLARELSEENAIRLVVLNSCQSAVELTSDPFAGIASSLVTRGIPAVVAMQYLISERAAQAFSEEFYRAVAEELPVDAAVSEARRAISHLVGGIEWATPVLYMRAADGRLFETEKKQPVVDAVRQVPVWARIVVLVLVLALVGVGVLWALSRDTPDSPGDLLIDQIDVFPSHPNPGEAVAVVARVTNHGERSVGPIEYDFRQDVLDTSFSAVGRVGTLEADASQTLVINHAFNWWGAYVSEVRIDIQNQVPETDELNNLLRYPVVTSSDPFEITFAFLPNTNPIRRSVVVDDTMFAAWGFRFEAVPQAGTGCEAAVPWIIVNGDSRYLGTGLPDSPTSCTDAGLRIVIDRAPVGGVAAEFLAARRGEFSLTAFDIENQEVDHLAEPFGPGNGRLEISGGFLNQLKVSQAVFEGVAGSPTQITRLELFKSAS